MLITDSPVWTTRLRQLSPQILKYIQENASSNKKTEIIHHIQISTRYNSTASGTPTGDPERNQHKPEISEKTAKLLSQSADSISHQQLKKALLKIASHGRSNTGKVESNKRPKTEK